LTIHTSAQILEYEFFGIDKVIAKIVRYFHSASLRGEESRQVLYQMGPVGSGKSSLVEKLQYGLESSPPFYAIENCPMSEDPLHLIPRHLRREFEKMLGIRIEGDLCPVCRFKLKEQFGERYEEVPVVAKSYSKRKRVGIGVVAPVDPNNQDTSVLIGSEDISKLDLYSEGDPRVLDLNGALNVGNRGMVEFNEAILDRIIVVKIPYNLRLSEEMKIYEKVLHRSDFHAHIAPHSLEIASMFAILTRLAPTPKCDLLTKLKLYNGEEVVEKGRTKKVDINELRDDAKYEGMCGISTRFIMKAIDNALSDNIKGNCINPISDNIADIIAEEAIIAKDKNRIIKVPIRGVKEYRFIHGENARGAGQSDRELSPGDIIKDGQDQDQNKPGQAGNQPGVDYYETDVTLEELIEIMFEDLSLPDLERKKLREIIVERQNRHKGYRTVGIRVRLDKRRTVKEKTRRRLATSRLSKQSPMPSSFV
jgi:predicted Ser/Thr protein kinase